MSTILTISPTLVHDLWIAGVTATVTATVTWYVVRFKRFAVDEDKALIKAVVGGEQAWHAAHRERFERAYASLGGDKPKAEVSTVPALSDRSHADEQAAHTDTDRAGMWRVLLGLGSDLVDRVHDWLPNLLAQWRERNDVGTSDGIGDVLAASGYELDIADEDELDAQRAEWVAANPPTNPTYKSHRCPDDTVAERDADYRSRHTAKGYETGVWSVIDAKVPAQRTGDEA